MIGRISITTGLVALAAAQPALAHGDEASVSQLRSAWDPAPAVIAGAGVTLLLFVQAFVRLRRRSRSDHAGWSRLALFVAALSIGVLPLISPLDEVGDSYLLSGHMLQHVLVGDVAPALALVALRGPLFFFLVPGAALRALSKVEWLRTLFGFLLRPAVGLVAWMVVIAAWHVPAAYDYALSHTTVHDLEHVSFIVVGLLVWMQILDPARRRRLSVSQRVDYMLVLFGAGAALAAVLVFARTPLYPAYAHVHEPLWGIAPLRDQQLAGLVMLAEQVAALGLCLWFLLRAQVSPTRSRVRRRVAAASLDV